MERQRPLRLHRRGVAAGEPGQDCARHRPRRQPHGVPGTAGTWMMTFSQQISFDIIGFPLIVEIFFRLSGYWVNQVSGLIFDGIFTFDCG